MQDELFIVMMYQLCRTAKRQKQVLQCSLKVFGVAVVKQTTDTSFEFEQVMGFLAVIMLEFLD